MTKACKKTIIVSLCLIMLFAIVGFSALTVSADNPTSGTCGENVTWALDDTGTITISGTGEMEDYNNDRYAPWHSNKSSVKMVVINDGITSIGNYAFYDCTGLSSIIIPVSVTSIGREAFENCCSLTSLTIGSGVTSIGEHAFRNCIGITSVTIPENVISIDAATFYGCTGLTSLTIPTSVTSIGSYAFCGCIGLTSIAFPASVTSIGQGSFEDCTGITSITIPDTVTDIGICAFRNTGYYNVQSNWSDDVLYIGDWLITAKNSITGKYTIKSGTKRMADFAFYGCKRLTNITIPDSVTSIGSHAFYDCVGLMSVTIPNSVTVIGENAFYNVYSIIYNGTATGSPWGATYAYMNPVFDEIFIYNDSTKTSIIGCNPALSGYIEIPSKVDTIENRAFYNGSNLKGIYISKNVTRIGDGAFENTALKHVYYEGSVVDKTGISFGDNNLVITNATWHYNSKVSDMPSNPTNPDNPSNPDNPNPPSTDIPEANIIKGNSADNKKTYNYRTTVTFTANVPEGGSVQWYVDGSPAGNGSTLSVKDKTNDYTVKAVVTDKNGNKTMDEEQVTIKHGLFDILIWFFVHLFNPGAYDVKQ